MTSFITTNNNNNNNCQDILLLKIKNIFDNNYNSNVLFLPDSNNIFLSIFDSLKSFSKTHNTNAYTNAYIDFLNFKIDNNTLKTLYDVTKLFLDIILSLDSVLFIFDTSDNGINIDYDDLIMVLSKFSNITIILNPIYNINQNKYDYNKYDLIITNCDLEIINKSKNLLIIQYITLINDIFKKIPDYVDIVFCDNNDIANNINHKHKYLFNFNFVIYHNIYLQKYNFNLRNKKYKYGLFSKNELDKISELDKNIFFFNYETMKTLCVSNIFNKFDILLYKDNICSNIIFKCIFDNVQPLHITKYLSNVADIIPYLFKKNNICIIAKYDSGKNYQKIIDLFEKINIKINFLLLSNKTTITTIKSNENITILNHTISDNFTDYKKKLLSLNYLECVLDGLPQTTLENKIKKIMKIFRTSYKLSFEDFENHIINKETLIFINYKPVDLAYGGGNQFVKNLILYLGNFQNIKITFELEENINIYLIIDIRKGTYKKYSFDEILNNKKKYGGKILYRINDCDITRTSKTLEMMILKYLNNIDHFVFNSDFIKDYYLDKYDEFANVNNDNINVIYNTVNSKHYFVSDNNINNTSKIYITTHHWSDNINKGYDYYYKLYEYYKNHPKIEFIFFGRKFNDNYADVPVRGPYKDTELGNELRKCHLYITASIYDACPMHVLEGLACGLPTLYINHYGGGKNICELNNNKVGEPFNNFEELLTKIDIIINNYDFYKNNIIKNIDLYNSDLCYKKFVKKIFMIRY